MCDKCNGSGIKQEFDSHMMCLIDVRCECGTPVKSEPEKIAEKIHENILELVK